jgi:hypothetical protein
MLFPRPSVLRRGLFPVMMARQQMLPDACLCLPPPASVLHIQPRGGRGGTGPNLTLGSWFAETAGHVESVLRPPNSELTYEAPRRHCPQGQAHDRHHAFHVVGEHVERQLLHGAPWRRRALSR